MTKQSKKQLGGDGAKCDDVANILIVVDVQNCFITGGSMGGPDKDAPLVKEIADIVKNVKLDYIVVTRDMHPSHHYSHMFLSETKGNVKMLDTATKQIVDVTEKEAFQRSILYSPDNTQSRLETISGLWPPHCRATTKEVTHIGKCANKKYKGQNTNNTPEIEEGDTWDPSAERDNNSRAKSNKGKDIVGNDISYHFDDDTENEPVFKNFLEPHMTLGLEDIEGNQNNTPDKATFELTINKAVPAGEIPVLQLYKGQLCGYEAYSAFMYHLSNEGHYLETGNPPVDAYKHTTGLLEVLLSDQYGIAKFKNNNINKINFIVCGLVGEVCIKYTIYYGYYLYNKFLQDQMKFRANLLRIKLKDPINHKTVLCLASTIFKTVQTNFIYSIYGTRFITNVDTTMGKMPLPNVVDSVKEELEKLNNFANNTNDNLSYRFDHDFPLNVTPYGSHNYTLAVFKLFMTRLGFKNCLKNN